VPPNKLLVPTARLCLAALGTAPRGTTADRWTARQRGKTRGALGDAVRLASAPMRGLPCRGCITVRLCRMKLAQSRVTAQGQISVPAEVRKRLELVPGSVLEWDAEDDRITVRRVGRHTFEDLHRALFSQEPQPRSLEDLKEGIRQHVRARHARR
jgi:AbrB family looped-hinge helix DNA binding protein